MPQVDSRKAPPDGTLGIPHDLRTKAGLEILISPQAPGLEDSHVLILLRMPPSFTAPLTSFEKTKMMMTLGKLQIFVPCNDLAGFLSQAG